MASTSPASMRGTTVAASRRSARCLGKMRPRLGSPTWWPARPMRWRPRLTAPGDSTWMTRSTAPMSMPSSSDEVATRPLSRPDLSSSSITRRCSRASEPWWALTSSGTSAVGTSSSAAVGPSGPPGPAPASTSPIDTGGRPMASPPDHPAAGTSPRASASCSAASSLRRVASRSASRRALTKISVERWARTRASSSGCIDGQMLRRAGPPAAGPLGRASGPPAPPPGVTGWPRSAMSSTGTITSTSSSLRVPASTMVTGRGRPSSPKPPRKRAISSRGRCVAERPMRWGGASHTASSRSSERARWAPRLVEATAWISSMITASTPARVSRTAEVSIR